MKRDQIATLVDRLAVGLFLAVTVVVGLVVSRLGLVPAVITIAATTLLGVLLIEGLLRPWLHRPPCVLLGPGSLYVRDASWTCCVCLDRYFSDRGPRPPDLMRWVQSCPACGHRRCV